MVVDIIVKSFNRPYYLERCIRSIYKFVNGQFNIKILDDGTPEKYLNHLSSIFPDVEIILSPYYTGKVNAIEAHLNHVNEYNQKFIPSQFWKQIISGCSDPFLLLEDDIWLTDYVNVSDVFDLMHKNGIVMLKLYWLGNVNLVSGRRKKLTDNVEQIIPDISFPSKLAMLNWFKLGSVYHRLGWMDYKFKLPFYNYYTVASAFFNKEYWLYLWEGSPATVQEFYQLRRATLWSMRKSSKYAKSIKEVARTSFITSATNNFAGVNFDIIRFNYHLNEAWLLGRMDSMYNFPSDFSLDYINKILSQVNDKKSNYDEWLKWIDHFKGQYQRIGCEVN